ncbi:MAG TPA: STAS domain-containing protein [Candidatus Ozemobacteraceae bacterium]|nr:STAS domain-containing protein [Candidatus Ozemobacteraceae bacterium]
MKIEFQVNAVSQRKTFILDGELDVHQAKTLKSVVMEAIEEGVWTYVIEMGRVGYIDSSGLGMLVYLKKEILRNQGRLVISKPTEAVLNVFRLTKLNEFFELS